MMTAQRTQQPSNYLRDTPTNTRIHFIKNHRGNATFGGRHHLNGE